MRRRLLILGWLIALGLSAILPLSALFHGIVHIGSQPLVATGTQRAPIVAIGSDVDLPYGSRSVVVSIVGDIHLRHRASDDLVALVGHVYLERNARVDGDVVSLLGGIYRAPGVTASGRLGGAIHPWDGTTPAGSRSMGWFLINNIRLGMAAGLALLLIGTCLTVVFPWQVVLISSTLRSAPVKSTAAGMLSLIAFVFLVVPLGLSLAGLPFALLLTGAASLAWLFGLTSTAVLLGRTISRHPVSLLWATAAGLVLLAVGMAIPLAGPLMVATAGLMGAGALAVALLHRARPATPIL